MKKKPTGMTGGKPRKRKPSVLAAKTRAWRAFSRFIRLRDKQCVTCGAPTTEAGHYKHNGDKPNKTLGGNELWYDERNIHGQCAACNRWRSGNLAQYALYLEKTYGNGVLQALDKLFHQRKVWTIAELNEIAERYESLSRDYGNRVIA